MCLSTVYVGQEPQPIAKNVTSVTMREGKLVLRDIMGVTTEVDAEIESVDLMENRIFLRRREWTPQR